jgi:hypothetical protein
MKQKLIRRVATAAIKPGYILHVNPDITAAIKTAKRQRGLEYRGWALVTQQMMLRGEDHFILDNRGIYGS